MGMRCVLRFALLASLASLPLKASAEETCPRAGTLGVSRTVEIDTTGGPGFGMEHYKAYDFLQDKEVVLTFDDGPQKYATESVLKALADECVKATFFSIGKMALGYPAIIRDVAKAGHTVGTHTWSHKAIGKLKTFEEGKDEIERGVSAVHRAVGAPIAPFFRFPTLVDTKEAVAYLGKRNIAMFSTDIDSVDYRHQTVDHLVKSLMAKLDKRGKGILLMHDIHKRTAQALPIILAQLKAKGYKIVHMTAKAPVVTLAEYDQAIEKETKGLPEVGAERPMSSIVKTVGGTAPENEAPSSSPTDAESEPEGLPPPLDAHPSSSAATEIGEPSSHEAHTDAATNAAQPSTVPAPGAADSSASSAIESSGSATVATGTATHSPVATVAADHTAKSAAAAVPAAPPATTPQKPHKSLMERAKETWKLWFGD
ncbi:MAG TPA: polysaccharide deacetylase family protein [Hyphomicrobium sp.]|nr:polysaccharide deacetylase family protein [Hyphomicrobium sp.]